jgi:hypothetical protein
LASVFLNVRPLSFVFNRVDVAEARQVAPS